MTWHKTDCVLMATSKEPKSELGYCFTVQTDPIDSGVTTHRHPFASTKFDDVPIKRIKLLRQNTSSNIKFGVPTK